MKRHREKTIKRLNSEEIEEYLNKSITKNITKNNEKDADTEIEVL